MPVLLVVDEDQVVLDDVQAQLVQRYAGDYRVESMSDPGRALGMLEDLADAGDAVALVLVAKSHSDATGRELFELARQLLEHVRGPSGGQRERGHAQQKHEGNREALLLEDLKQAAQGLVAVAFDPAIEPLADFVRLWSRR